MLAGLPQTFDGLVQMAGGFVWITRRQVSAAQRQMVEGDAEKTKAAFCRPFQGPAGPSEQFLYLREEILSILRLKVFKDAGF